MCSITKLVNILASRAGNACGLRQNRDISLANIIKNNVKSAPFR